MACTGLRGCAGVHDRHGALSGSQSRPMCRPAVRDNLRCRAALMTEAEPVAMSSSELLMTPVNSSPTMDAVASLEALWSPSDIDDARVVLEQLQRAIYARGTSSSLNVVAMSGGTGSALVAYLVASVFEENTVACIAKSGSVPPEKLERARYIADLVGIDLWEMDPRLARVPSRALTLPQFPETVPRSERALHAALAAISAGAAASAQQFGEDTAEDAVVFCGINAHDMENAARVGAAAASQLGVVNPLAGLSPEAVTALAQVLGLPDWGHAEVSFSRPRWPMARHPTPKLARLARSLSKGRLMWARA